MDQFSFLSVLISVILGLAVAEILQGFRGLLWSRTRIQVYWPVIGWAVLVLLVCFQHWWSSLECEPITIGRFSNSLSWCCKPSLFTWSPDWFSRFLRGSIGRPKRELLRALPLVFLTRRRHHYGERMQTPSPGWQAPKPNVSHIPSDVRCDTICWRTDAPGVVS